MDFEKRSIAIWIPKFRVQRDTLRAWIPSRGNALFTLVMIAALLWTQSVGAVQFRAESAASTGTIAYQGRLADSSGNPLTQTLNMSFRLYSASSGGAPLWTEQWTGSNGVQVSDGLFNVMLGSLTPIPQSVITGNSTLFLGITVGTDDEMSPRVQLGSVPFAVQALTVPDGSITKAKLAADVTIGVPDASITTAKLANGAVTSVKVATGQFLGLMDSSANRKIQFGTATLTPSQPQNNMYYGGAEITFSTPFSQPPIVSFAAIESAGNVVSVVARSISATQINGLQVWSYGQAAVTVHWIAIGN